MWGILDRLFAFYEIGRINKEQKQSFEPETREHDGKKEFWMCFVPLSVSSDSIFRKGILPNEGTSAIYTINSLYMIKPDADETLKNLNRLYLDAIKRVKEAVKKGYSINLIGLSLGNIFAIKVAGDLKRVNNIVSIVRGAKLGSSAWKSALTSVVLGKNGNTMKTYEKGVSSYNPISHVSKINAKKVLIRLGAMDKLIPFEEGKKLAEAFLKRAKKSNLIVDYKVFKLADHCSAMFFYSLECIVKKYINRRKDC